MVKLSSPDPLPDRICLDLEKVAIFHFSTELKPSRHLIEPDLNFEGLMERFSLNSNARMTRWRQAAGVRVHASRKQPPQAQRLAKGGHLAAPGDDAATPAMGNAGGNAAAGQALASAGRGGAAARAAPGLHGPPRSRAVGVAGATSAGPRAQVHGRAHQGHDAGEGAAARMDCHELIDLQTAEEQETVRRVLRKLHNERHGEYHPVFAGLREMAGHEPSGPGAAAD